MRNRRAPLSEPFAAFHLLIGLSWSPLPGARFLLYITLSCRRDPVPASDRPPRTDPRKTRTGRRCKVRVSARPSALSGSNLGRNAWSPFTPPFRLLILDEEVKDLGVRVALSMLKFYKSKRVCGLYLDAVFGVWLLDDGTRFYLWVGEISPLMLSSCRFVPTCSEYSMVAYKKYGVVKGTILTAWRLCRCNPLGMLLCDVTLIHLHNCCLIMMHSMFQSVSSTSIFWLLLHGNSNGDMVAV